MNDLLDMDLAHTPLSTRCQNCLKRAGKKIVKDLIKSSARELLKIKGFGEGCLRQVRKLLNENGLILMGELDARLTDISSFYLSQIL